MNLPAPSLTLNRWTVRSARGCLKTSIRQLSRATGLLKPRAERTAHLMLVSAVLILGVTASAPPALAATAEITPAIIARYVAVDNVCAWPNLTLLRDGTIAAIIHNQPSHSRLPGDIDCQISPDGVFWKKSGSPAPNDPETVRMNVAAGLAGNGDLVVICSGWERKPGQSGGKIIPVWVSRSADGGKTWTLIKSFPEPEPGWTHFVPFGPIHSGADGRLHTTCYARGLKDTAARHVWHFTSNDDGRSWQRGTVIGSNHNETSIFHAGGKRWLAAARTNPQYRMELFRSDDDGLTWKGGDPITETRELNAHLLRLKDGRILLSYGKRLEGQSGVLAKFSRDDGATWSAPVRLMNSTAIDCGYPSSVQRADGKIVTAYYSQAVQNHERYHLGVALWDAPPTGR